MSDFHKVKIKTIQKTTNDCLVVEFDIPENLQQVYSFKQGQYLTLKATIENEEIRRSYSLCSSPVDESWKIAIKQIPNGSFSTYANTELKVDDFLEVMTPSGEFFVDVDVAASKNYIAFAAGSGITLSLIHI